LWPDKYKKKKKSRREWGRRRTEVREREKREREREKKMISLGHDSRWRLVSKGALQAAASSSLAEL
jgi:alpha-galactosidase/6-phospho-beta-glucosidase family protein